MNSRSHGGSTARAVIDDPDNPLHPDERTYAHRNAHWTRRGGTAITDRTLGSFGCWCGSDAHGWPGKHDGVPHPPVA